MDGLIQEHLEPNGLICRV